MAWQCFSPETMTDRDGMSATSAEVAKRLLAHEGVPGGAVDMETSAAALKRVCARVSTNLRDTMGDDGTSALLARALARTEALHPALQSIRHLNGRGVTLDGVDASIKTHGVVAVTAAIEALLTALMDILAKLIGEDMATRVIDTQHRPSRTGGGAAS